MNTVKKKKTQFRSQFSLVNILSFKKKCFLKLVTHWLLHRFQTLKQQTMEILVLNNVLSGKMYKQILMLKRDRILCVNLLSEFCLY